MNDREYPRGDGGFIPPRRTILFAYFSSTVLPPFPYRIFNKYIVYFGNLYLQLEVLVASVGGLLVFRVVDGLLWIMCADSNSYKSQKFRPTASRKSNQSHGRCLR